MKLFELTDKYGVLLSPYCWSVNLSIIHKQLDFDSIPVKMSETNESVLNATNNKYKTVPTLITKNKIINGSFEIALFLEEEYPQPQLFPRGTQYSLLVNSILDNDLNIFTLLFKDILRRQDKDGENAYKRLLNERSISWERLIASKLNPENTIETYIAPFVEVLKKSQYLNGSSPAYVDYLFFGRMQLIYNVKREYYNEYIKRNKNKLLDKWFNNILDLNNGYARRLMRKDADP